MIDVICKPGDGIVAGIVLTSSRYRLLRSFVAQTVHWNSFDPFYAQKEETFRGSSKAIYRTCFI